MDLKNQKVLSIPLFRAVRLVRHVLSPMKDPYLKGLKKQHKMGLLVVLYIAEIPLLFFDLIGLPEVFALFQSLFKKSSRSLYDHEIKLAQTIFGDEFYLTKARIDEQSRVGTHGGKYAFVSYYYINCQGRLNLPILIHELVHILQFEQIGSPYAIRNMMAHIFPPTYNYGGLERILSIVDHPDDVHLLNYEQRADIFSDYCLLLMNRSPEWGSATQADLQSYFFVIQLLIKNKID